MKDDQTQRPANPAAHAPLSGGRVSDGAAALLEPSSPAGFWTRLSRKVLGPPRDLRHPDTHRHIVLIAFLAWVGLGADGLSSACYGPEEAFKALGPHAHLGLYLAIATAATVFIIAVAYNQTIELFPSGGGGYKVATRLVSARAGLVSGAALVVDYVLTIAISVAAGVDALFSLLPYVPPAVKVDVETVLILVLIVLNMRGMKETIQVLMPIFVGFVLTHAFLIVYGIGLHLDRMPSLIPETWQHSVALSREIGPLAAISLFLKAYSLGGGTYTGIEAVSNNINRLAEPRVTTGSWTMFYMAASLAFMAGGIILLYLLWDAKPVPGQTLNAVTFTAILSGWQWDGWNTGGAFLLLALALEAGLLLVAANAGFLGGPAVLANMAVDLWVPHQFAQLSNRLVTRNGILLMGGAALASLLWTSGQVDTLVVLYSINVFLTFSLTLLGLCRYWWNNRDADPAWRWRFPLSVTGLTVTCSILLVTLLEKFTSGAWVTVIVTGGLIWVCLKIRAHYDDVRGHFKGLDAILGDLPSGGSKRTAPPLDPEAPTAALMVSNYRGLGMHTLLWVQRLFPDHFKNFLFLSVGEVDSTVFRGAHQIDELEYNVGAQLERYVDFCHKHGLAAASLAAYGTDPVEELERMCKQVAEQYPRCVFFAGKLIFPKDNLFLRLLHNQTAEAIQRRLHFVGLQMVILPVKVS
jgi:hypothetical protein